jgi:predicted esterase
MGSTSPARVALMISAFALALGCSDDGGTAGAASSGAGNAGTPAGGSSAGTFATSAGTSSGGETTGGLSQGGAAGMSGGTFAGAGMGGGGGMIDPNGGAPTGPASGRHTPRPSGSMAGTTAGYWEYLPPHYGNGALYPLLIFRHGIGENGNGTTDLQKVLVHGPPKLIEAEQWPEARSFVVLSVQHPGDGCSTPQENDDFINFALDNYDVDPKRVYITGLSCGAIGSWNYLGDHTNEIVAAAVLICGDGRPAFAKAGCNLGKVPIWAFHGEADPTVDPKGSIDTVASLKACTDPAAVDVKLTTYPGVPHDSWTMTYDLSNPANDIYAWLMTHTK